MYLRYFQHLFKMQHYYLWGAVRSWNCKGRNSFPLPMPASPADLTQMLGRFVWRRLRKGNCHLAKSIILNWVWSETSKETCRGRSWVQNVQTEATGRRSWVTPGPQEQRGSVVLTAASSAFCTRESQDASFYLLSLLLLMSQALLEHLHQFPSRYFTC